MENALGQAAPIGKGPRAPGKPLVAGAICIALCIAAPALADTATLAPSGGFACSSGEAMARIELLFGMSRPGGGMLSEAEWTAFIDAEVTPRFPEGLTVLTGYGQWRNSAGVIARETSRMLIVWHKPAADLDSRIEAIRVAFKTRYAPESVMRVDGMSCVSF